MPCSKGTAAFADHVQQQVCVQNSTHYLRPVDARHEAVPATSLMKPYLNPELPAQFMNFNFTLVLQIFCSNFLLQSFGAVARGTLVTVVVDSLGLPGTQHLGPSSGKGKETIKDIPGTTLEELLRNFSRPQHRSIA